MQPKSTVPPPAAGAQAAPESDDVFWTVPETAKRLGVKRSAAYAYVRSGELPSIKLHGRILVPSAAVLALRDRAMAEWGGDSDGA